jgi:hypothetical protein
MVAAETSLTRPQALEMAYDFSDRRADVWPNVNLKYLDVHELGATSADATEGMWFLGRVWERCRYEWSDSSGVTATVHDSNILEPGSTWHLEAVDHDGRTQVVATFARSYKSGLKGRFAETLFRVLGARLAAWDLRRALKAVERREGAN